MGTAGGADADHQASGLARVAVNSATSFSDESQLRQLVAVQQKVYALGVRVEG